MTKKQKDEGESLGSLFSRGLGIAMLQVVINPLLRDAGSEEKKVAFQFAIITASFNSSLGL